MRHGFKTKGERISESLRQELGLSVKVPLEARQLAHHMRVPILTPADIHGMLQEDLDQLFGSGSSTWHGITIVAPNVTFVIHNSSHSVVRQESDIMHELAHLICAHKPSSIIRLDGYDFPIRTCSPELEDEANWICGCLKLPRDGLIKAVRSGMTHQEIADRYLASTDLVSYRIRITGVDRQIKNEQLKWGR